MNINILALVGISTASGAIAGGAIAAGFVNLQDVSPGTPQTGHINVTGNTVSGKFGSGVTPTLARVQVKETGTLQGIRAESNTGIAVFGTSTSTTGVAPGGHFTNKGPGAALIGDAQNTAGSTIGGLFTNRAANGAGIHARAIGAGNTATGLLAENTSASGKALVARNTGNNNSIEAGTANDSLVTKGAIPRHNYVTNTPSSMVPIAYGTIDIDGGIIAGSGNFTVTRLSAGKYDYDVVGVNDTFTSFVVIATAIDSAGNEICSVRSPNNGDFQILVYDTGTPALEDSVHYFVAYRAAGFLEPPASLAKPDMGPAKDIEEWQRQDPAAFGRWKRAYQAWEREALSTQPASPTNLP